MVQPNILSASCQMRPNRHIALLNQQQNIKGEINLWQLTNVTTSPLYMRIRLNGFKVPRCAECSLASPPSMITDDQLASTNTYTNGPIIGTATTMMSNENETSEIDSSVVNVKKTIQPSNDTGVGTGTGNAGPNERHRNYPINSYGIHIHEGSDMTYDCQSVGGHYNPFNMTHGGPNDRIKHLGDLGNIFSNHLGEVEMDLEFYDLNLFGPFSILNRTIVIHNNADDFGRKSNPSSRTIGNSGIRIACCLINELRSD
ncbi:low density lipoprotein receptor adapter protein 1-B-like [Sarcoptes scabiei]|nr:low density lipoprotein receptor adapter protein 1-B-like [Sarcoptes scabiei]